MPQATGNLHGLARLHLRGNLAVPPSYAAPPPPPPSPPCTPAERSPHPRIAPPDSFNYLNSIELIQRLADTGIKHIEATSFVSAKWVPQLADGAEVMRSVVPFAREKSIELQVLTPNMMGLENALAAGATQVTVFASATEVFSKANQNCTVDQALDAAEQVAKKALSHGLRRRSWSHLRLRRQDRVFNGTMDTI
ncbi:hypothetical protein TI39_contig5820g00006 [Zymoseptoria brevis]|uniref:hydroxymethylglutaryl-CoA lyase n=1 Tax=Zymoseptoria brevis TaxID=1047168 RepID=A0A0F4G686_9PEZI|nr:hypothetical protein TI39_contig5820g00006 [Zymoseptoria brevis]